MISIAEKLLQWLILVSIGQHGRNVVHTFVLSYQSCSEVNTFRPAQRVTTSSHFLTNDVYNDKSSNAYSYSRIRLNMVGLSKNDVAVTANEKVWTKKEISDNKGRVKHHDEEFIDLPPLEVIEFEGIFNFRSALPGTGLPLYRCAALDNSTASDTARLLTPGVMKSTGSQDSTTRVGRNTGLNICTIIDLRNTDEIIMAYKYRTYEGAVSLYSFFRIVLDTATSLRMKANTNSFYSRSFDSIVRDLHYSATTSSPSAYFSNSLYQSSPPSSSSSSSSMQMKSGRAGGVRVSPVQRRNVFELPFFGESEDFWVELKEITVKSGPSSILADFRWLFDPKALNTQLTANLAAGGLPLLYEVLMEVSSRRIASAMFLCLVVCEDHVSYLEKEKERITVLKREIELERRRERERKEEEEERVVIEGVAESAGQNEKKRQEEGTEKLEVSTAPSTHPSGLLFHCAQGKDRTGILAMLLTFCLYGDTKEVEDRAVLEYSVSGELLRRGREREDIERERIERESKAEREKEKEREVLGGGGSNGGGDDDSSILDTTTANSSSSKKKKKVEGNANLGEIQSLKGSPPEALRDTLVRVRSRYGGSVLGYLDKIGFTKEYRKRFQVAAEKTKGLSKSVDVESG